LGVILRNVQHSIEISDDTLRLSALSLLCMMSSAIREYRRPRPTPSNPTRRSLTHSGHTNHAFGDWTDVMFR
jgi:hypothetical protein